jgi:DNA-binding MarR family transcriptional regulator
MLTTPYNLEGHNHSSGSDVSVIRREFVELTGNLFSAVILNQLLYWTLRVKDFDYLLEEEKKYQPSCNVSPRHGWIYKTAQELNEETMLGLSPPSIRKYLKVLIDEGWIDERKHPTEKWDHTTQYRVNLRQLQEDLIDKGRSLPEVYLKAFGGSLPRQSLPHNPAENHKETADEKIFASKERNFSSEERNFSSSENSDVPYGDEDDFSRETLNQRNFASNEKIFASKENIFGSNEKSFASNTENTTENTNKEKLATHAQGDFSDEGVDITDESLPDGSVAAEMCELWKHHVVQNFSLESGKRQKELNLTANQKDQLESLFAFHFKSDMRLWEQFCLRVKASSFLMGYGERKWTVDLDWILKKDNLSKILSGKYDDALRKNFQDSCDWKIEKLQSNPALNAEKAAILASIKDPVWKCWCTQLAEGVFLQGGHVLHHPLSTVQLDQIANAWFLEVEDDRLVWVGSSDQTVLDAIEKLRLKVSWVFAKEYPKATTFRTRLVAQPSYSEGSHHE